LTSHKKKKRKTKKKSDRPLPVHFGRTDEAESRTYVQQWMSHFIATYAVIHATKRPRDRGASDLGKGVVNEKGRSTNWSGLESPVICGTKCIR